MDVFMEMEELSQALDAEEFTDAAGRLYDSLSLPQKNVLILKPDRRERSISNKRKHDPGHQFQPRINQKSKKLATRKMQSAGKNVTDRLYDHAKAKQMHQNMISADTLSSGGNQFYHSQMQSYSGSGEGTQLLQMNTFAQHQS